ncbi:MAG: sugar phosphate nucleotidyltransferase, partial [Gammaproteobacteria bacterium]|nr:sugar phosphate nucleotidyltransferase [Gammaproteobacteria bacterium]
MLCPVVLCGGAGTRLWPLSRAERPKQFLPLVSERSLFQDTILRLSALTPAAGPSLVVCNRDSGEMVDEQAAAVGLELRDIILEPVGRNTAPAVAVAAQAIAEEDGEDAIVLVMPADHVILDQAAFSAAAQAAYAAAAGGGLVTFGIVPDGPETGYGYILKGADAGSGSARVEAFVEKPDRETAESYLRSGQYLWNSGMFMFRASVYLQQLRTFAPDLFAACERAWSLSTRDSKGIHLDAQAFADCRADSIDYAVMERTQDALVVPLDAGWTDVGSWGSLYDTLPK